MIAHTDIDAKCCAHLRRNFPGDTVLQRDLRDWASIIADWGCCGRWNMIRPSRMVNESCGAGSEWGTTSTVVTRLISSILRSCNRIGSAADRGS